MIWLISVLLHRILRVWGWSATLQLSPFPWEFHFDLVITRALLKTRGCFYGPPYRSYFCRNADSKLRRTLEDRGYLLCLTDTCEGGTSCGRGGWRFLVSKKTWKAWKIELLPQWKKSRLWHKLKSSCLERISFYGLCSLKFQCTSWSGQKSVTLMHWNDGGFLSRCWLCVRSCRCRKSVFTSDTKSFFAWKFNSLALILPLIFAKNTAYSRAACVVWNGLDLSTVLTPLSWWSNG